MNSSPCCSASASARCRVVIRPRPIEHLAERQPAPLLLCKRLLQPFGRQLALAHQESSEEGATVGPRIRALVGQRLDCHGSCIGARPVAH